MCTVPAFVAAHVWSQNSAHVQFLSSAVLLPHSPRSSSSSSSTHGCLIMRILTLLKQNFIRAPGQSHFFRLTALHPCYYYCSNGFQSPPCCSCVSHGFWRGLAAERSNHACAKSRGDGLRNRLCDGRSDGTHELSFPIPPPCFFPHVFISFRHRLTSCSLMVACCAARYVSGGVHLHQRAVWDATSVKFRDARRLRVSSKR